MIFTLKPENELEKDGRKKAPLYGEEEIVCPNCHRTLKISQAESAMMTCICSHHFRIGARKRIGYMTDSFTELFGDIRQRDPLSFPGYGDKLEKARKQSGEEDSAITGTAIICGMKCALFAMDPFFMMGSMGCNRERFTCNRIHSIRRSKDAGGTSVSYADGLDKCCSQKAFR